jgi:hypothetical protein
MKLEDQIISLEQAMMLRGLGIIQLSLFYHIDNRGIGYEGIKQRDYIKNIQDGIPIDAGVIKYFSAFTVAELGVMLPARIKECRLTQWSIYGESNETISYGMQYRYRPNDPVNYGIFPDSSIFGDTEAIARAKLLIALMENKTITPEECNQRLLES